MKEGYSILYFAGTAWPQNSSLLMKYSRPNIVSSPYLYFFYSGIKKKICQYSVVVKNFTPLTFGWPFVNISLTIHPTHSKLYMCVILITSRVFWYTWKAIWSIILKIWPSLDPYVTPIWNWPNRPKCCQNSFWTITTSKPSITNFRQNGTWVLLPLHLQFNDGGDNFGYGDDYMWRWW